jgi:hypothetical protein
MIDDLVLVPAQLGQNADESEYEELLPGPRRDAQPPKGSRKGGIEYVVADLDVCARPNWSVYEGGNRAHVSFGLSAG